MVAWLVTSHMSDKENNARRARKACKVKGRTKFRPLSPNTSCLLNPSSSAKMPAFQMLLEMLHCLQIKIVHIITSSSRDTGFATGHLFFIITRLHWLNQGYSLVLNKEEAVDGQALAPLPGFAKYTMDGAAPGPLVFRGMAWRRWYLPLWIQYIRARARLRRVTFNL